MAQKCVAKNANKNNSNTIKNAKETTGDGLTVPERTFNVLLSIADQTNEITLRQLQEQQQQQQQLGSKTQLQQANRIQQLINLCL